VAEEYGMEAYTTDIDPTFKPTLVADILDREDVVVQTFSHYRPDIIWASPPCESFSVGSIGKHWNKDHTPKTKQAEHGLTVLDQTIRIISTLEPSYFFIENPRGKMRKVIEPIMEKYGIISYKRDTICYCRYGDTRMKPTDIWSNCYEWQPKNRMCHNGNPDHESAPRGARTGTQGIKGYAAKSVIPQDLFHDIFSQLGVRSVESTA